MSAFYDISEELTKFARNNQDVNKVTYGDNWQVNLSKQDIFSIVHFNILSATLRTQVILFSIQITYYDLVDVNKTNVKDLDQEVYISNDNRLDVWNTGLNVLNDIYLNAKKGTLYDKGFHITTDPSLDFFQDEDNNKLFGVTGLITIEAPNDHAIC